MGDILPNDEKFRYKTRTNSSVSTIRIGNITKKVMSAIDSVLDMYFANKSEEFTVDQVRALEARGKLMEANIKILWNLKQTLLFESVRQVGMRKLHAHNHLGEHIQRFGPPLYANTDSFESAHRKFTTSLWRNSSRRHCSINSEMMDASIIQQHSQHLKFYTDILECGGEIINFSKPYFYHGEFETQYGRQHYYQPIYKISGTFGYCCKLKLDSQGHEILLGHEFHKNDILKDDTFFGHVAVKSMENILEFIQDYLYDMATSDELEQIKSKHFYILEGARVEANLDADILDHSLIYCSKNFKGQYKRYDYVVVECDYDDGTKGDQVAQVVNIIQIVEDDTTKLLPDKFLFIVQYMQEYTNPNDKTNETQNMFKHLKWEVAQIGNSRKKIDLEFRVDIIDFENIIDVAVVIPFFSYDLDNDKKQKSKVRTLQKMPVMGEPTVNDRFFYIKRRYFDRSGWNQLYTNNQLDAFQNLGNYLTVNTIKSSSSTSITASYPTMEIDENEDDEDDEEY